MFRMGIIIGTCMFFIIGGFGLSSQAGDVSSGVLEIISNIEKNNNQTVLCGHIDTLVIERENVKFILGPGDLSLFDFGSYKICAMVFQGKGHFKYFPPNPVELYQLKKFTSQDSLKGDFESACFFFVTPVNGLFSAMSLTRKTVDENSWAKLSDTRRDALQHLLIYLPNKLLGDLLSERPGTFFYVDFELKDVGHLVICEDPTNDDWYRLYNIKRSKGIKTADIFAGYSPVDDLPSQRGVVPIDVYHYDIDSRIESGGKMVVKGRIHFVSLLPCIKYIYLNWYYKNKIISARDSGGDLIQPVYKKEGFKLLDISREECGLGLVFNKPLTVGDSDYVDIEYECKSLEKYSTLFFIKGQTYWYPQNITRDLATYTLTYNCPKKYEVVSCGDIVESRVENGRNISRFELDYPSTYVSFNVGSFEKKEMKAENFPPVEMYLADEIADASGIICNVDRLGQAGADVLNSLAFYTSMFGPCPFDTIRVASIPYLHGQGSPGLIHLSWIAFLGEDMEGYSEQFRAHEVAHQWWGHIVDNESYRDTWIIEGLADYCGFWFYQMSSRNTGACDNMLRYFRDYIISGTGLGSEGSKAGPVVLGYRLSSSKSDDYKAIVYHKGAYIFHMIRYLLHDYKTGSDEAFSLFLKDLIVKFKDKLITTQDLQELLEYHVGEDMNWFFEQWVYGVDIPEYRFSYEYEKTAEGRYKVICHVKQKDVSDGFRMIVPLTVLFDNDRYIHLRVWVDKPENIIDLPMLPYKPEKIIFNTYSAVLCK